MAAAANYTSVLSSDLILDTGQAPGGHRHPGRPRGQGPPAEDLRPGGGLAAQGPRGHRRRPDNAQVLMRATPVGWRVDGLRRRRGHGRHLGDQRRRVDRRDRRPGADPRGLGHHHRRTCAGSAATGSRSTAPPPTGRSRSPTSPPRPPPPSWSARPASSRSSPMHQDRRRAWARAVLVLAALAALLVVVAPAAMAQDQPAAPRRPRAGALRHHPQPGRPQRLPGRDQPRPGGHQRGRRGGPERGPRPPATAPCAASPPPWPPPASSSWRRWAA